MRFQPSPIVSVAFALGALAGAINALPLGDDTTDLGPSGHNSTAVERRADTLPSDCQLAQYFTGNVDCYYKHNNGANWLNYIVQITPTGQDTDGWCKGIEDNIKGTCGKDVSLKGCNKKWEWKQVQNPTTNEVATAYGIDMNFHYKWPWNEKTRDAACVQDAISKATCGATTTWTHGGCYRWADYH
ncbi:hypothetical protein UCDDS831_g06328 [Diplodia seriata]|uniref:Secreted protein n=1 Tax=Diplodia seriata TaxID=420778 RepID=A0A0G2GL36_9PEZI|nr:hypothetical protein UCDDS831_g06328 [Diplodia seriata]